jgi:hypothetical protein
MGQTKQPRSVQIVTIALLLAVVCASFAGTHAGLAQEPPPPVATDRIEIVGLTIQPAPATLVVPKNVGTFVTPLLIRSDGAGGELPALPEDAVFLAELRGPAFGQPIPISAPLHNPLPIPPLPLAGNYTLDKIRLVHNGETLIVADPDIVPIEVIDRVIETQVTVTPLTAEEIERRGIYIDQSNYQVVNFTVALGLEQGEIEIEFPMLMPRNQQDGLPPMPYFPRPSFGIGTEPPRAPMPSLKLALQSPNVEMTGFGLMVAPDAEPSKFNLPPIPGVVIIPGNIGYLNQFFSVMVKVSNAAPNYSNLVVKDLKAEILLPRGRDNVIGTSDDPLRMARLGNPPVEQPKTLPVVGAGADSTLGTADDIVDLRPQASADAEFLVEGVREGNHTLNFKITGVLHGLPSGPVPVEGVAVGMVEVRNPRFSLTFHHPEIITAGEEYDFSVTVTNISETPANFVSLSLLPRSLSGALLLSEKTVQVQTVAPGDAETVTFRLQSQRTGSVTATSLASDGIPGKFELFMAVGELGIPLSPNVISLPKEARELPKNIYDAAVGLLGQAHALGSAPFPPKGLLPMSTGIVYERATDLSAAGQRYEMGEALHSVLWDLALDYTGNSMARIDEQYADAGLARRNQVKQDYRGFDELMRKSRRGAQLMDLLGRALGQEAAAQGIIAFQQSFAESVASRPDHVSVVVGDGGDAAPVIVNVSAPDGKRVGLIAPGTPILREIPFGNFLVMTDTLPSGEAGTLGMALLANPQPGTHTVEVIATGAGQTDLGLVLPVAGGLQQVTFDNVAVTASSRLRLTFSLGGANSFTLSVDDDGDGAPDRTLAGTVTPIVDPGPRLIAATQIFIGTPIQHPSKYGVLMAALFSEEIDLVSAQHELVDERPTHYSVANNRVQGAYVQPRGRVVTLSLREGIGPFTDRELSVVNIKDIAGNIVAAMPQSVPIRTQKINARTGATDPIVPRDGGSVAGTVRRADGTPVTNARIQLEMQEFDKFDRPYWVVATVKDANPDGSYSIDYVRRQTNRWTFVDMDTNERGQISAAPSFHGHSLALDMVLRGRGSIVGHVYDKDGNPLPKTFVRAQPLSAYGTGGDIGTAAQTDASGAFILSGVPVGTVSIEAVHNESRTQVKTTAVISEAGSTVVQNLTLFPIDQPQFFGAVEGQVFRADGVTPAPNVPVYTSAGGVATTDANGFYRIDRLIPGGVTIRALDQETLQQADIRTIIIADRAVPANLILYGGTGTVRGVVMDSDGNLLPDVDVYGGFAVVKTNSRGEFTIPAMPVGVHEIQVVDETRTQLIKTSARIVAPGDEVTVQLVMPVHGTLAGTIFRKDPATGTLIPVPNLEIYAIGPRNETLYTDSLGRYRFEKMPRGEYTISAFLRDFSDGNIGKTKIVFKDETRVVNIVFRGTGTVRGIVFDDDGVTPLGARVAIGETVVKFAKLIPRENPECLPNMEIGDVKIELPECKDIGIDFQYRDFTRQFNNDVSSGAFTFRNVFVGDVMVSAANPFSPQVINTRSRVEDVGATAQVTLSLQSTGEVIGTVYDPDGNPAPDVIVKASNFAAITDEINALTDENGEFRLPLIPAGGFILTAQEQEGRNDFVGQTNGSVKPGQTVNIPIRLLRTGAVTVTVRGVDGNLLNNATVTVQEHGYPRRSRVLSTVNGVAVFSGADAIHEGNFSVYAEDDATKVRGFASGVMRSRADDPVGAVAVAIQLDNTTGVVSGRFLRGDRSTGIANAQVILSAVGATAFATTDATGSFRFEGVRAGAFSLRALDPTTSRFGSASGAVVSNGQLVTVDMVQSALGTVTGVVRRSTDNAPIPGVNVSLNANNPFGGSLFTTADQNGAFTFNGVPSGNFSISTNAPGVGNGYFAGSISREGEVVNADMVIQIQPVGRVTGVISTVTDLPAVGAKVQLLMDGNRGQQSTTVDSRGVYTFERVAVGRFSIQAEPQTGGDAGEARGEILFNGDVEVVNVRFVGSATLRGVVTMWDNRAINGVNVTVVRRGNTAPYFNRTTGVDASGQFTLTSVPLGQLEITAFQELFNLGGTTSITLTQPGATETITILLEPSGAISGTVARENGDAVPGMALELIGAGAGAARRFGVTDANGRFQFRDLALNSYTIKISDPLGAGIVDATAVLSQEGQILDLGTLRLDDAPPAVLSIEPINGAQFVATTQPIVVTFSEPVQAASVNLTTLPVNRVIGAVSTPLTGTWTLDEARTTATFTPNVPYRDFTRINVRVTTSVRDRVNRAPTREAASSFTTTDSTPPSFVAISPAANALGVPVTSLIRVQWSEIISPTAFTGSWPITLTRDGVPVPVVRAVEFTQNNMVAVLTPLDNLASDTLYQVTIGAATDLFGNRQPADTVYTFRTQDLVSPVLQALQAVNGTQVRSGDNAVIAPQFQSSEDVAQVEYFVDGQSRFVARTAPFTYQFPVRTTIVATTTVTAQAVDFSGNVSERRSLVLDLLPDAAPGLTILAPQPGATVGSGQTVSMQVRAEDDFAVSQVRFLSAGATSTNGSVNAPANIKIFTPTFTVSIPPTMTPGRVLTLTTNAVDNAGQSSPIRTLVLTVTDATAPTLNMIAPANASTVDAGSTVSVTVRATDNGRVRALRLTASGGAVFSQTVVLNPAASPAEVIFAIPVPASALPTQPINLAIGAEDEAGNLSPLLNRTLSIRDVDAPAVALRVPVTSVIQGTTISATVAATDVVRVASLRLRAEGGGVTELIQNTGVVTNAVHTFGLPVPVTVTAGTVITLTGAALDPSSNLGLSAPVTVTVLVDEAPEAQITSPAAGSVIGTDTTLAVSAVVTDDVGVAAVRLQTGGAVTTTNVINLTPAAPTQTANFNVAIPGAVELGSSLTLTVVAVDSQSQETASEPVTVIVGADRTRPVAQILSPADNSLVDPGQVVSVTVEATDNGAVAAFEFEVSGAVSGADNFTETVVIDPAQPTISTTLPITVPADATGNETLTVRIAAVDAAGNRSTLRTLTLPVRDILSPATDLILTAPRSEAILGRELTVVVSATDEVGVSSLRLDVTGGFTVSQGAVISPMQTSASRSFTVSVPVTVTDGSVLTFTAVAADAAGNLAESTPVTLTAVTDALPAVTVTAPATVQSGRPLTVTVEASDDQGIVEIRLRAGGAVSADETRIFEIAETSASGEFVLTIPANAALNSSVVITAAVEDTRGQISASSPVTVAVIDATRPTISAGASASQVNPGSNVTINVSAADNGLLSRIELTATGAISLTQSQVITPMVAARSTSFVLTVPATATINSQIAVTVQAVDSVGNVSTPVTVNLTVRDNIAPTVTIRTRPDLTQIGHGQSFTVTVTATDTVAVGSLFARITGVHANSWGVGGSPTPVAERTFTVQIPATVSAVGVITLTGEARDTTNNLGVSAPLTLTVIRPDTILTGTVTNTANAPVAGAAITVTAPNGTVTTVADESGRYTVTGITAGNNVGVVAVAADGLRRNTSNLLSAAQTAWTVNVRIPAAPVVTISSPISGAAFFEGSTITMTATAASELTIARVVFSVDGREIFTDTASPYAATFTLPLAVDGVTVGARAQDIDGNTGFTTSVISVTRDTRTTVIGRVIDATDGNQPLAGVTVSVGGLSGVTDGEGRFSIANVLSEQGDVTAVVAPTRLNGKTLKGSSAPTPPIPMDATDVGDLALTYSKAWDGEAGDGLWQSAANWSDNTLPATSDDVYLPITATVTVNSGTRTVRSIYGGGALTLSGGTLTVDQTSSLRTVSHSGGTLTGVGVVTVTEAMTWTGGVQSGTGKTVSLGTLHIEGSAIKQIEYRTLENHGVATWSAGDIYAIYGSVIRNEIGGSFTVTGNNRLTLPSYCCPSTGTLENRGVMTNTGVTTITIPFNNNGSTLIESGSLQLSGGGASNGALTLSSGTALTLTANYSFGGTSITDGDGRVAVTAGVIQVNGVYDVSSDLVVSSGILNFNAGSVVRSIGQQLTVSGGSISFSGSPVTVARLSHSGGTLTGGSVLTVTEAMTWTGGVQGGTGKTVSLGTLHIEGSAVKQIEYRTLENHGVATWSAGDIYAIYGSVIRNETSGSFMMAGNNRLTVPSYCCPGVGTLENLGVITKTSTGLTTITVPFNNNGSTVIESGSLQLSGGGISSGALTLASTTALTLTANTTFGSASSISGDGRVAMTAGVIQVNGIYDVRSDLTVSSGILNFNAGSVVRSIGQQLTVSGGSISFSGSPVTVAWLSHSGGTIQGSSIVTVTEAMTWTGGIQGGTGRTVSLGTLRIGGSATKELSTRALENRGVALWSEGDILLTYSSQILNEVDGVFNMTGSGNLPLAGYCCPGTGTVLNRGQWIKTSAGSNEVRLKFTNGGELEIQNGTLSLTNQYEQLASGRLVMVVGGSTPATGLRQLTITGQAALTGTLTIVPTANFQPADGESFRVLTFGSRTGQFANVEGLTINDNSRFDLRYDDSSTPRAVVLDAVVTSTAKRWDGGANDGLWQSAANWSGDTLPTPDEEVEIPSGAQVRSTANVEISQLTNSGALILDSGAFTVTGVITSPGALTVNGGSLGLSNTLTVTNVLTWTGGSIHGAGLTVDDGGMMTVANDNTVDLHAPFHNRGEVTITQGSLGLRGGGLNNGRITVGAGTGLFIHADYTFGAGSIVFGEEAELSRASLSVIGSKLTVESSATQFAMPKVDVALGGHLELNRESGIDDLTLYQSIISGDAYVEVGALEWIDGTISGDLRMNVDNLGLQAPFAKTLDGASLRIQSGAWGDGGLTVDNGASIEVAGTLQIDSTGSITWGGAGERPTLTNNGEVILSSDGNTQIEMDFINNGALTVDLGVLTLIGNAELAASSAITLPVNAEMPNPSLNVYGTLALSGTLSLAPVYVDPLPAGESMSLITYDSFVGEFSAINGTQVDEVRQLQPIYGVNALDLQLVVADSAPPTVHIETSFTQALEGVSLSVRVVYTDDIGVTGLEISQGVNGIYDYSDTLSGDLGGNTYPSTQYLNLPVSAAVPGDSLDVAVTVYDAAGNSGRATLSLPVADIYPPQVSLLLPQDQSTITAGSSFTATVIMTDTGKVMTATLGVESASIGAQTFTQTVTPTQTATVTFSVEVPPTAIVGEVITLTAVVYDVTSKGMGQILTVTVAAGVQGMSAEGTPIAVEETNAPLSWSGGAGDGLWRNEGNWSTGRLPTAADSLDLGAAGIRVDTPAVVGSLSHSGELLIASGSLSVGDSYHQNGALTLVLSGGADPLLTVTGTATLAAPLNVILAEGFDPAIGERFTVIVYGERVGEFANGEIVLGNGKRLLVVYNDGAGVVVLEVVQPSNVAVGSLQRSASPEVTALINAARLSVRALQSGVDTILSGEIRVIPWLTTAIRQIFLPQIQR